MATVRNMGFENALRKRFGGKFKLSHGASGVEYLVCCPFCITEAGKVDKKYKLSINPGLGVWQCWRCGKSGTVRSLLSFKGGQTTSAKEVLAALPSDIAPPGDMVPLIELPDDHIALRYIRNRNFDIQVLDENYGVRFCYSGRIFGRVFNTTNTLVFPIWFNQALVGWQSRLLYNPDEVIPENYEMYGFIRDDNGEYMVPPKYMTSPGLDKGRILFNYDNAKKYDTVVICEGTFDAIKVGLCAVAALGKGVSEYQERLIKAYWKSAIILLDPDAHKEAIKLKQSISRSIPCKVVVLEGYKDAGETPVEEIWRQINEMKG